MFNFLNGNKKATQELTHNPCGKNRYIALMNTSHALGDLAPAGAAPVIRTMFFRRCFATGVDILVALVILFVWGQIFRHGVERTSHADFREFMHGMGEEPASLLWLVMPMVILMWMYHAFTEGSANQATLGKFLARLKVTNKAGGRISFSQATTRFIMKLVALVLSFPFVVICVSVGALFPDSTHGALALCDVPLFVAYLVTPLTRFKQPLQDFASGTNVTRR